MLPNRLYQPDHSSPITTNENTVDEKSYSLIKTNGSVIIVLVSGEANVIDTSLPSGFQKGLHQALANATTVEFRFHGKTAKKRSPPQHVLRGVATVRHRLR